MARLDKKYYKECPQMDLENIKEQPLTVNKGDQYIHESSVRYTPPIWQFWCKQPQGNTFIQREPSFGISSNMASQTTEQSGESSEKYIPGSSNPRSREQYLAKSGKEIKARKNQLGSWIDYNPSVSCSGQDPQNAVPGTRRLPYDKSTVSANDIPINASSLMEDITPSTRSASMMRLAHPRSTIISGNCPICRVRVTYLTREVF